MKTNIKFQIFLLLFTFQFSLLKADWVQVNNGLTDLNVNALCSYSSGGINYLFAGTLEYPSSLFRSTNDGNTWSVCLQIPNDVYALTTTNNGTTNYVFAGTGNGMGYTTNNGANWYGILGGHWTLGITASGSNVFAGCMYHALMAGGVYKSTNFGLNWVQTFSDTNTAVNTFVINGNYVFAGAGGGQNLVTGVFRSTDLGSSWTQTPFTNTIVLALAINENYIFAGTSSLGVYISTNNGSNWIQTSINIGDVHALLVYQNAIFAAGGGGAPTFAISTNNGINWIIRNEGLNSYTTSLCISNSYIFAGTSGGGVYRRSLSELVGVNKISEQVPKDFELKQNYPNPFNPSTTIKYDIPPVPSGKATMVTIKVYDILGREVSTLVNEVKQPGYYEAEFNGTNLASGVYFYRIEAGKFTNVKKMVLVK